ncbi:MAG: 7TM-DISM domain-containing protein, partial [Pseudomonadota bacterium]
MFRLSTLWLLFTSTALGVTPVEVGTGKTQYTLDSLEVLDETTDKFSFTQIKQGARTANFIPAPSIIPPIDPFSEAYWFRFALKNTTAEPQALKLEVVPRITMEAILFIPDTQGNYQKTVSGYVYPANQRPDPVASTAFSITLAAHQTYTAYLKLKPFRFQHPSLVLWSASAFTTHIAYHHMIYGLFFGALL